MFDQLLVCLGVLWGLLWLLIYAQRRFSRPQDDTKSCEHLLQFLLENRARFPNLLASNINPLMELFRKEFRGVPAEKIRPSDFHTFAAQLEVKLEQAGAVKQNQSDQKQISEQEL